MIIDDEYLARKVVENFLNRFSQLQLVKSCQSSALAMEVLSREEIDLVFLDIKMPVLGGLEFYKLLKDPPAVIFTTAHSEYAAESYDLEAIDYLLKPISFERFEASIDRYLKRAIKTEEEKPYTFFKVDGSLIRIDHHDLTFARSAGDYIILETERNRYITHMTMKQMVDLLPSNIFVRVHRSYMVNIFRVTRVERNFLYVNGHKVPIGDTFKVDLLTTLCQQINHPWQHDI
ncbi:MAG: response regulator transcription factor [Saprospiraceae bacterium]|nr:response regulator transcription factor [Saprospiraceae bacterium]